ncbi:MAG TPA: S41 family peptidase, partial [Candidatus Sulfotelmatobacter sp.]
ISTTLLAGIENATLDAAHRQGVIQAAAANLTKYYVDPDIAQKMAAALLAHESAGDDDAATDGEAFADLLTRQMMEVSHDKYVVMAYSAGASPANPPAPSLDEVARYRTEMEQNNCTIETAKILPHNIGYLKFNAFPDATVCGKTVAAAMTSLNNADAIIFDLRDNRGGYANMVALISTYLFDHPTHLNDFYNRGENSTEESWTLPPVPDNRLADKPVFVLTSPTTFSAAEGFAYDLKMLKRATLVGETTSGRGHVGMPHRIDDHFTIRIPGMRVTNPISKTNWQGTGVEPDVKVRAADALATARRLAEKTLPQK